MRRFGVVLVTLGVTLAGCGDRASRAPAAPTTSSSTSRPVPVEEQVLAAYYAHWAAFHAAADPPDPDHPDLERTTTGRELEELRRLFTNDREVGLVRRGEVSLNPKVVKVQGDQATVRDCYRDLGAVYVSETNQVVEPPAHEPTLATFILVRTDGRWKVSAQDPDLEAACDPSAH